MEKGWPMWKNLKNLFLRNNLQHAEDDRSEEVHDLEYALHLTQARLLIERETRLEHYNSNYSKSFLNQSNYDDRSNYNGRENYGTYEIMDNADGAAILDIYASATILSSAHSNFRPYQVMIYPNQKSRQLPDQFWQFVDLCEKNSELFKLLYGMVRDGYKYGASYEKFSFEKTDRFPNRDIISCFESIPTMEMYPLHDSEYPTKITEFYRRKYIHDYYDRKNFLTQEEMGDSLRSSNQQTTSSNFKNIVYDPKIIMPFFNSKRSFQYVGESIFKPMIDSFHSQRVSEAKMLLQRITRSSQKLIHHLETEGASAQKLKTEAQMLRDLNRKTNSIKELDNKLIQKQIKIEPDEDIFSLMRNGKGSVTALSGDGDIKAMRDIEHWRSLQYTIAHIPPSYIVDPSINKTSRESAAEVDKLFERIISTGRQNLSDTALMKFYQCCIDLYFNKIGAHKNFCIEFRWEPISTLEEIRRQKSMQIRSLIAKIWRLDMDIPDEFIYKNVFKMNSDEIKELQSLPKPNPSSRSKAPSPGENSPTAKSNNPKQRNRDMEPSKNSKENLILEAVKELEESVKFFNENELEDLKDLLSETLDKI